MSAGYDIGLSGSIAQSNTNSLTQPIEFHGGGVGGGNQQTLYIFAAVTVLVVAVVGAFFYLSKK
jgi:hypothetical protein